MARLKVLLILDHAPDYRESFIRELATMVDLTVVAQPCEEDNLTAPSERFGYRYIQLNTISFFGFRWQVGLQAVFASESWDAVCVDLNVRQLARLWAFIRFPHLRHIWLWRGHVFGSKQSNALDVLKSKLLEKSAGCLAYSRQTCRRVAKISSTHCAAFNNSEVSRSEFREGVFQENSMINMVFVGRYQPRKKLHRLVELALHRDDVCLRLIGPGMNNLSIPPELTESGRIHVFGRTSGHQLNQHFDWADIVVNPGHAGLLIMNAARHGKPIVVDSQSVHAPEICLADEAGQPFVDFSDLTKVSIFIDRVRSNRSILKKWAAQLQQKARESYTIEYMADVHFNEYKRVRELKTNRGCTELG